MNLPILDMADPLVGLIRDFRAGLEAFNALPSCDTQEQDVANAAATYGSHMDQLAAWDRPAQSHEGAVEALRLAVEENDQFTGSEIADNMVRAALAYFDATPPLA